MSATEASKETKESWSGWMYNMSSSFITTGTSYSVFSYAILRQVGWFVVTAGIITALPLIFEVKREAMLEDVERAKIGVAIAEGRTPQELAMEGLKSAIEPSVL